MTASDWAFTPALELGRRIRAGEVSPVEAVERSLARIAEVNPHLNAFCFVYPDEARERARAAERAVRRGEALGPLHGVPIAIKDLTPTRGKRTTLGSFAFEHWVPERDAVVVERLERAGAITVGKTTTPEFAFASFTDSPLWGITRNPWNPERTPGGSSGGSAVAVATGCVPLAEGSDMGGSVRIPAAFCGIVGFKPSLGRIPFDFLPSQLDFLSNHGPLARTVADAALFLQVTQGPDDRDLQSLPCPAALEIPPPADLRGLRVALSVDLGYYRVDPEVEANLRSAAASLRAAGAIVEEVALPWTRAFGDAWARHWQVFHAAFFGQHLEAFRERMHPEVVHAIEAGRALSALDLKRTEIAYTEAWEQLRPILADHQALVCPTESITAPEVGRTERDFDREDESGRYLGMDMTMHANALRLPAISVPSGFSSDGLPTAMQIIGRRYDDATVLRLAAGLEAVRPWAQHRPPI
jgi:Asp-tRNA(Asn)/Glu-tRNA(Gln) amidotransferase A subunit family amidase